MIKTKKKYLLLFLIVMCLLTACGTKKETFSSVDKTKAKLFQLSLEPTEDTEHEEEDTSLVLWSMPGETDTTHLESNKDSQTIEQTEAVEEGVAIDVILKNILERATFNHTKGYRIDESFVLWYGANYGRDSLEAIAADIANAVATDDVWYKHSKKSIHVLWYEYCMAVGMYPLDVRRTEILNCKSDSEIVMNFTGDLNFDERMGTMKKYQLHGLDSVITPDLQGAMKDSDLLMINAECTFSERGTPIEGKAFTFRANPKNVHILNDLGVTIAGVANNHMCDYGPEAVVDTVQTIQGAGIPTVGAGANLDEAKAPYYYIANGKKIAITAATQIERTLNYTKEATDTTPGVLKSLNPDKYVQVIREAKAKSDYVVAFIHWGTEGTNYYEQDQMNLAKAFVEAGADVIIGGHTHCLQGISYVEDVPVIYSLGNFWFGSTPTDGVTRRETALAQVIISDDGKLQMRFIPCVQENQTTYLVTDAAEKQEILRFERSISNGVTIDEDGYVTKAE